MNTKTTNAASALFAMPRARKNCRHTATITASNGAYYVGTVVNWGNPKIRAEAEKYLRILQNAGFIISIVTRIK